MFNISVPTVRLYEAEGLIIPQKTEGNHRLYTDMDVKRIKCIRNLIEEKGLNLAGIRMMFSALPCWELKSCSEEKRNKCDAYLHSQDPCWIVKNKCPSCNRQDCSICPVYTQSAECSNIKTILQKYWRAKTNDE